MQQQTQTTTHLDLGAGYVTFPNLFTLPPGASPNCLDIKFNVDGSFEKRLGSDTSNTVVLVSSAATGFRPDSGGTLSTGLQAVWALDEQVGNRLDSFGSNTLTDNNTVGFRAGILGNAASFVAANSQSLSLADNAAIGVGTQNVSIVTWVLLTSKTLDQSFVSQYHGANTSNRGYRVYYDAQDDRFKFSMRGGATETIVSATSLGSPSTATWYMLTAIGNSAANYVLLRANTFLADSASFTVGYNDSTAPFLLGAANSSPGFQMDTGGNLQTSLVALWKLSEASGSTRLDATTRGNNLTDNNTVGVAAGRVDSGAVFATSAFLSRVDSPDLNVGGTLDFTLCGWVYHVGSANNGGLFTKTGAVNREFMLIANGVPFNSWQWLVQNSAGGNTTFEMANTYNAWTFLEAWHDSARGVIGLRVNNATVSSAAHTTGVRNGTNPFEMGRYDADFTTIFSGTINNVCFFKRLLTAAERADLYKAGSGNRYSTDYANAALDQTSFYRKALSNQEIIDHWNAGSANAYNAGVSNTGFGMFDFGAGLVSGQQLRWLTVAAGTGVFASSNRGVTFVAIATDRGADYQEFTTSRSFLVATSETGNKVLYWAGSVGTFMQALAPGSAPPAKHALDFAGFLLLMNHSGGVRDVRYADNTLITTSPFTSSFQIPGAPDDEITAGATYQRNAYVYTKRTVSRVSHVGGNPDFSVHQIKDFGVVPRTLRKVTYMDLGEVMIGMGFDRHIRLFDGSEDRIISTPIEQKNGLSDVYLNNINVSQLNKCHAEVDTEEQTYRLWVVMQPSTETTHAFCLNLRTGAWYPYTNANFNAATMAESGNAYAFMAVKRDGFVHILNSSNTDAGAAIKEFYQSPFFFGESPRTVTKSQKMAMYFSPTSSGTLYYQERVNFAAPFEAVGDTILLTDTSSLLAVKKVLDVPRTQNVYQFQLSSSGATTTPWKCQRIDFEHRDLGIGGG